MSIITFIATILHDIDIYKIYQQKDIAEHKDLLDNKNVIESYYCVLSKHTIHHGSTLSRING